MLAKVFFFLVGFVMTEDLHVRTIARAYFRSAMVVKKKTTEKITAMMIDKTDLEAVLNPRVYLQKTSQA